MFAFVWKGIVVLILWVRFSITEARGDFSVMIQSFKGFRFDYKSQGIVRRTSQAECVLVCKETAGCRASNVRLQRDYVECEPLAGSTTNTDLLTADERSVYLYKLPKKCEDGLSASIDQIQSCRPFLNVGNGGEWTQAENPYCSLGFKYLDKSLGEKDARNACEKICERMSSCIYYHFVDASYSCDICAESDDFAAIGFGANSFPFDPPLFVKRFVERNLYGKEGANDCTLDAVGGSAPDLDYFNQSTQGASRITGIQLCASEVRDTNITAGIELYFDGIKQPRIGCGRSGEMYQYPMIEFAEYEDVMRIKLFIGRHSGKDVVQGMAIYTNMAVYGPHGKSRGTEQSLTGYDLLGIHGKHGDLLYSLGAYFRLCERL